MAFIRSLTKLRHRPAARPPEWIVVGLGNPGSRYSRTRHNIGFMCANRLAQRAGVRFTHSGRDRADVATALVAGCTVLIAEPQTFMNESGQTVSRLLRRHGLPPERCLVLSDDVDLRFGTVRIRASGGSGGQRGLQSIIDSIDSREFPRVRIGIGRGDSATRDHVLSEFDAHQRLRLSELCDRVVAIVEAIVSDGVTAAMNSFNGAAGDMAPAVAGKQPAT